MEIECFFMDNVYPRGDVPLTIGTYKVLCYSTSVYILGLSGRNRPHSCMGTVKYLYSSAWAAIQHTMQWVAETTKMYFLTIVEVGKSVCKGEVWSLLRRLSSRVVDGHFLSCVLT